MARKQKAKKTKRKRAKTSKLKEWSPPQITKKWIPAKVDPFDEALERA